MRKEKFEDWLKLQPQEKQDQFHQACRDIQEDMENIFNTITNFGGYDIEILVGSPKEIDFTDIIRNTRKPGRKAWKSPYEDIGRK